MNIKQAIELLLNRMNTRQQAADSTFGAFGGSATNVQVLQKDANAAIELWRERRDPGGLIQFAATLHAYGNLTDAEYEQVIDTLDGEK